MGKLLNKFTVNGYNPFNTLNVVLGAVSGICLLLIFASGESIGDFMERYGEGKAIVIAATVCSIILILRNLKLKNPVKIILISAVQMILGIIVAILVIFVAWATGGNINTSNSTSGQADGDNANQWQEQYSQTKGKYYTDGNGNFKDQYGNDVYNPQSITDYDKI